MTVNRAPTVRAKSHRSRYGNTSSTTLWQISTATAILAGAPSLAHATPFVAPAGVSAYRLIFVTADPTSAASTNISTYNAFANEEASLSTLALPATTWSAVVSTPSVSAATNVDCGSVCDGLPIYLVDGTTLVATTQAILGSSLINHVINETQSGRVVSTNVWTGTTWYLQANYPLGSTQTSNYGSTSSGPYGVLDEGNDNNNGAASISCGYDCTTTSTSDLFPIYAISGEIMASPIPEPVTGSALLVGGLVVTRVFRRRRTQVR